MGFILFGALTGAHAAPPESCTRGEVRQFDFYLGEWRIAQRIRAEDGGWLEFPATTSVRRVPGGCALVEDWRGEVQFFWAGMMEPVTLHGLSVRAWDPEARRWNIYWMDTRAPRFGGGYSGGFTDGRGEFFREREAADGKQTMRITFSNVTAQSLDWELALSRDDGETWRSLWTMRMTRIDN